MSLFTIPQSSIARSAPALEHHLKSCSFIASFISAVLVGITLNFATADASPGISALPSEYGTVIYQTNEDSPKHLYIVGISHKDPATNETNDDTIRTQTEVFRIGEWLNRQMGLELLLPEGYFVKNGQFNTSVELPENSPYTSVQLHEKLADASRFVNAEMLLLENFAMRATQVEDRNIYNAVRASLIRLKDDEFDETSSSRKLAELKFLQELRTARLLQNIPEVVETELRKGNIRNSSTMFTIGLKHIPHIIRYLGKNQVNIEAPENIEQLSDFRADLNLVREGYSVTIILPRTLADNTGLLAHLNLDRIRMAASDTVNIDH